MSTIPFDKIEEFLAKTYKLNLLENYKNKSSEFYEETLEHKNKYYNEHLNRYKFKRELTTTGIMPSKFSHVFPMTLFSCGLNNSINNELFSIEAANNHANNIGIITDSITLFNLRPKI